MSRNFYPKFRVVFLTTTLLLALTPWHTAVAQAVFGQILGTVTAPNGAPVPNATVTVTDVAKGTSTEITTNADGQFRADHLIPDIYDVKVAATGYKTFTQTGIQVFADTSPNVNAVLTVGATTETVEVSALDVPQLKTDRADVSTELTSMQIQDLPIPDRNFTNLQLLMPGAQQLGWSHAASENPQGSKQIQVDGQAFAGVAFQLDGTDNQDPILGIIVVNPNADSLSETKITTQNFDAEFGKAVSSVVTAQTKSGSNKFHGSAFDYRQSNANRAREPFTQGSGQITPTNPFPDGLRNQFGGSIGGPIIRDKLFFFGDYQGVRQKIGTAFVQTVPSTRLISSCLTGLGCDFSEYATALGTPQLIYRNVGGVSTPYIGNVIPRAELSAPAMNLLKLLQPYAPNTAGTLNGLKNNYAGSGTGGFNSDQWDVRGDVTLTSKTHSFARFSRFTDTLTGKTMFGDAGGAGFGIGGYGGTSKGANDSLAVGVDIALNPTLITDVRFGYFRYNINTSKYNQGTSFATQLGIPNLNTGTTFTSGAPGFQLQDVGVAYNTFPDQNQGSQYGADLNINRCNCPLVEKEDQFQLANNWTKMIGTHSVKFGADLRYARNLRVPSDSNRTGLMRFSSGPTSQTGTNNGGLGFATFVLGQVTEFKRFVSTSTNAKEFQKRDFFYVQDTWRVTQKLTANLGVRYEFYFPESVNGAGNGALLNLENGYLQVASVGQVASNMNYEKPGNTWNPRVGMAYQMNEKTVIRAGYGRSFDIGVFGSIFGHAATQNLPILANQDIVGTGGNQSFAFQMQNGPTAAKATPVPTSGLLPNPGNLVNSKARPTPLRLPTLDAWNIAVQRSLSPTISLTVGYAGNKGTHTLGDGSGNTVNPNEAAITLPAQFSVNGKALTYDPKGPSTITPTSAATTTSNSLYLKRYYGGKLPACADAAYAAAGGVLAANGGCGWTNDITYYSNDMDTHFNALQISLAKKFSRGLSLNANYAYQHATSLTTGFSTWSHEAVKGNDGFLRRQQLIGYGTYELPFGHGHNVGGNANAVVNQLINGFEISSVVTYSSGLPFNLGYSTCSNQLPNSAPCRVNGDPGSFKKHITGFPGNKLQYYDAYNLTGGSGPFTIPGLDQIGTAGRNTGWGPRFFNADISAQKNFQVHEVATIQFRADAYNAFNHINWGNPGSNIDQPGTITSGPFPDGSANPRQFQFSLRVEF